MGDSSRIGSSHVGGVYTNPLDTAEGAKPKGALRDGTTVEQGPARNPPTRNTSAGTAIANFFKSAWQELKGFVSGLFTRPAAPTPAPATARAATPPATPVAAPPPDPSSHASDADCDGAYTMVEQDCAKLGDLPQFMRNQQIPGINKSREHVSAAAKDFASGLSSAPGSLTVYDGAIGSQKFSAEQAGKPFHAPPPGERVTIAKQAAANLEAYLTAMIGGLEDGAIQAKVDALPQAICDTAATALRALDDHLAANDMADSDVARNAKQSLAGKLLGNRVLGPALTDAKAALYKDAIATAERNLPQGTSKSKAALGPEAAAVQDSISQLTKLLPQIYSNNPAPDDVAAINGQLKSPVGDWKAAFNLFVEKVAERGAGAADAASQRAVG